MKSAVTLVELIIIIVILGIIAVIAIPRVGVTMRLANESAAQGNLEIISAALENYATVNNGNYATSEANLTGATPPYLYRSFCAQTVQSYTYTCTLNATDYTITAAPSTCGQSGSQNYTIITGGVLSSSGC